MLVQQSTLKRKQLCQQEWHSCTGGLTTSCTGAVVNGLRKVTSAAKLNNLIREVSEILRSNSSPKM